MRRPGWRAPQHGFADQPPSYTGHIVDDRDLREEIASL